MASSVGMANMVNTASPLDLVSAAAATGTEGMEASSGATGGTNGAVVTTPASVTGGVREPGAASISLYNRWRPLTFADQHARPFVGQEHVTRTLRNAVAGGQLAHAYLFCGPRGTGKTSAARILARAVNCKRGQFGEPCNQCENCLALLSGRQLDLLIEIDGASNRGIDDARALRERLMQRPGGADLTGRYKVYIIDEVHMLTTEAFNALLKSIEEPPPHVIFVLATTDPQKVPATVASRCQRFDFKPVALDVLVRHLAFIAAAEGAEVEPAGLELLARAAAGGVRDAVSLLDQAMAYAGADHLAVTLETDGAARHTGEAPPVVITAQQVQAMLGLTDFDAVCRLVDSVAERDLADGLRLLQEVSAKGADLRQFARQVLEFLRALMLMGSQAGELVNLDDDTRDAVQLRVRRVSLPEVVRLIKLFTQAEQGLKSPAAQPQLPLELAVVEAVIGPTPAAPPTVAPEATTPVAALSNRASRPAAPPPASLAPRPRQTPVADSPPAPEVSVSSPTNGTQSTLAPEPVSPVMPTAPAAAEPVHSGGHWPTSAAPASAAPASAAPASAAPASASEPGETDEDAVLAPNGEAGVVLSIEAVKAQWPAVLAMVRQRSKGLEAVLRDGVPLRFETDHNGPVLVLHFNFAFHATKVQDGPNLIIVQKAVGRALGERVTVRCEVAEQGNGRADREAGAGGLAGADDPVVAKAMRMWNARVMAPAELAALEALPVVPADAWGHVTTGGGDPDTAASNLE